MAKKALEDLLLPEKVVTFDFPGCAGLTFDLAFLSKEQLQKVVEKCTKIRIDPKTRQQTEQLDDDLFLSTYVSAIIKGWDGFKFKYLNEFIVWKTAGIDQDDEMDYSEGNAITLMKSSTVFDNWVSDQISDLGKFTSEPLKKSSTTSSAILKTVNQEST